MFKKNTAHDRAGDGWGIIWLNIICFALCIFITIPVFATPAQQCTYIGQFIKDAGNASMFYQCDNSLVANPFCCAPSTYYCPERQTCDFSTMAGCSFAPINESMHCRNRCDTYCFSGDTTITDAPNHRDIIKEFSPAANCTCAMTTRYRCHAGYYGTEGNCTKCPDFLDAFGEPHTRTSQPGATSVTGCSIENSYTPICPLNEPRPGYATYVIDPYDRRSFYNCQYDIGYVEEDYVNGVLTVLTRGFPIKFCCKDPTGNTLAFDPDHVTCNWSTQVPNNPAPMPDTPCVGEVFGCPAGKYGTSMNACENCPSYMGGTTTSIRGNNFSITDCYVPTDTMRQDITGMLRVNITCPYQL